jgi:hypothetical protein
MAGRVSVGIWAKRERLKNVGIAFGEEAAVRNRRAFSTTGLFSIPHTAITALNSPVGCSTERVLSRPGGICATRAPDLPGSTQAVATVTAARTLINAWHS